MFSLLTITLSICPPNCNHKSYAINPRPLNDENNGFLPLVFLGLQWSRTCFPPSLWPCSKAKFWGQAPTHFSFSNFSWSECHPTHLNPFTQMDYKPVATDFVQYKKVGIEPIAIFKKGQPCVLRYREFFRWTLSTITCEKTHIKGLLRKLWKNFLRYRFAYESHKEKPFLKIKVQKMSLILNPLLVEALHFGAMEPRISQIPFNSEPNLPFELE